MNHKKTLYIGIDINTERAMISLYHDGMHEVQTISASPGEERYQIPTAVFVAGDGKYFYGHEALRRQSRTDGSFFTNLLAESLNPDHVIYRNILVCFLARLIRFTERYDFHTYEYTLSITVPTLDDRMVPLFEYIRQELRYDSDHFFLMDYGESFFAHTYHQESSIWIHDVALFDFQNDHITYFLLHSDAAGRIRRVSSFRDEWYVPEHILHDSEKKDAFFSDIIHRSFDRHVISGVYLIGDGFDGKWMHESLRAIGKNKRVFLGKNLYTQGACYAAYRSDFTEGWNYYYDCSYKLQGEVSLKTLNNGEPFTLKLTSLGENWFKPTESYYVLYDGNPSLDIQVRTRERINALSEHFLLDYLPERDANSIRLRIRAVPRSGSVIEIHIQDDGFGDLFESSGKEWCFPISIT